MFLLQSDALLCILEELWRESGELEQETQTDKASTTPLCQLGVSIVDGEVSHRSDLVGSPTANVDTINELIQADHHYYKEEPSASIASSVASVPSNIVSTDLLNGSEVLPTLASNGLEGLGAELALPSSQMVVVSSQTQSPATPSSAATTGWAMAKSGTVHLNSNTKAAMATMVDPNIVCAPRPVRATPTEATVPEVDEGFTSFPLDMDLDYESLEGLLSLDAIDNFPLQDPEAQQQQQAVITTSAPVSATVSNSKSRKKKQSSAVVNSVPPPPPPHVSDWSHVTYGLDSEVTLEDNCQNGGVSPDSGFSGDLSDASSPMSDCTPSPGSVSDASAEMDGAEWQEDFTELKLFPDIGFGVFST